MLELRLGSRLILSRVIASGQRLLPALLARKVDQFRDCGNFRRKRERRLSPAE